MGRISRRAFMAAAVAMALAGCSRNSRRADVRLAETPSHDSAVSPGTGMQEAEWRGHTETRLLLDGTIWAAEAVIHESRIPGPSVFVLAGVHGNEPGAWLAAEQIATWKPAQGSLIIVPHANRMAMEEFERTLPELGDLNRLYPGRYESDLPMERMAAEILDLAREFRADLLLDLHESWGFRAEYPDATGFYAIGQTVTTGPGPLHPGFGNELAARVNPFFTEREQMIVRYDSEYQGRNPFFRSDIVSRRSSLAAGDYVEGLTPVLIEMGQEDQDIERRVQLHLLITRTALAMMDMA